MILFRRKCQNDQVHSKTFGEPKAIKESSQTLIIEEIKPKHLMKTLCFCNLTCEKVNQFFSTQLNLQGLSRGNAQDAD